MASVAMRRKVVALLCLAGLEAFVCSLRPLPKRATQLRAEIGDAVTARVVSMDDTWVQLQVPSGHMAVTHESRVWKT